MRSRNQLNLPGQSVKESHAHRGKILESDLERTHGFYKKRGLADVSKIPDRWESISRYELEAKIKEGLHGSKYAWTGQGYGLTRKAADVDYVGIVKGGRLVKFDAKETAQKSFPLANVEKHQVDTLYSASRVGAIAGLLISFYKEGRYFFVTAEYLSDVFYKAKHSASSKKSISIAVLEANEGVTSFEVREENNLINWYDALKNKF